MAFTYKQTGTTDNGWTYKLILKNDGTFAVLTLSGTATNTGLETIDIIFDRFTPYGGNWMQPIYAQDSSEVIGTTYIFDSTKKLGIRTFKAGSYVCTSYFIFIRASVI